LLAVILFGYYVLFDGFQNDNSATMAPNLTLNRWRLARFFFGNTPARPLTQVDPLPLFAPARG
jgi:hypothetical protein